MIKKIKDFFLKNQFRRKIGVIIGIFIIVIGTFTFITLNIGLSLIIDFDNKYESNLIATIGLTASIATIYSIITDNSSEKIKKQNEELKKEIREIKELIEKEPKEYKIDVKVIT